MTIRKIRNWWWVDFSAHGQRYRYKSPANSASAAKDHEELIRVRLARGEPPIPPKPIPSPTFEAFVVEWFDTYVKTNNKPSEQEHKRYTLRKHLLPYFAKRPLDEISAVDVEQYKASRLRSGLAPKSINNHLAILRKCLNTAFEWRRRLTPPPKLSPLRMVPPHRDFLTIEESAQLVSAATDPMWRAMILLALRTGMRRGELFGLEWPDVDFARHVITVRRSIVNGLVSSPKNHRERYVAFPASVRDALLPLARSSGLVFHRPSGRFLAHDTAARALGEVCRRAGLRHIGWHTLRHSCASQLAMLRGTVLEAQRLLGHSTISMTERYTHVVPNLLHEAVAVLDSAALGHGRLGHPAGTGISSPPIFLPAETQDDVQPSAVISKEKHTLEGVL